MRDWWQGAVVTSVKRANRNSFELVGSLLSSVLKKVINYWQHHYHTDVWRNYTDRPPWRHIRRHFCCWMHYHDMMWSAGACLLPPKIQIFEAIDMILYHCNGTIQYCLHITYYQYFYQYITRYNISDWLLWMSSINHKAAAYCCCVWLVVLILNNTHLTNLSLTCFEEIDTL